MIQHQIKKSKVGGPDGVPFDLDFIDFKTAQEIIGGVGSPVHRATVHRLVRAGYLSPPVHPSPGISRFIRGQFMADVAAMIEGRAQ